MASEPIRLTAFERLDLIFHRTPRLIFSVLTIFLGNLRARAALGWPAKRTLGLAFLRARSNILTERQLKAGLPSTRDAVATFCAKHDLEDSVTTLPCGDGCPDAYLHTIALKGQPGRPKALFYLHGGGYVSPVSAVGQLPVPLNAAQKGGFEALVVLEYSLAPAHQYPLQLIQAARALESLLATYAADDIVLMGDSAGGNLALGLLAHAKAPHPDPRMPSLARLQIAPLRGALLISPGVTTSVSAPSFAAYGEVDMIWASKMEYFCAAWGPPTDVREVHAEPILRRDGFWRDVVAAKVLMTAGGVEAFRDDVVDLAELMGAVEYTGKAQNGARSAFGLGRNEVHVQAAVDSALGLSALLAEADFGATFADEMYALVIGQSAMTVVLYLGVGIREL